VQEELVERRTHSRLRRDLNDIGRDKDGHISEAEILAIVFKIAMLYVFVKHTDSVLRDWMVLLVFCSAFLAPDLLKKIISLRTPKESKP